MSSLRPNKESGFALILALLALVLLTTMGLALSNTTSVELQISTNHRWSASARYNAEAGIEYAKSLLVPMDDWGPILPPVRGNPDWLPTAWDGATEVAPTGTAPFATATRNFENWQCDERGYGMGYGVVYDDGNGPQEYQSQVGGVTLNGAFTLWLRRPVMWADGNGEGTNLQDYPEDDVLVLVSEGVAPYTGAQNANAFAATNRAVYTIETLLTRGGNVILDQSECSSRQGQAGGSASGGNTSGCVALRGGNQVTEGLPDATGVGTGTLLP